MKFELFTGASPKRAMDEVFITIDKPWIYLHGNGGTPFDDADYLKLYFTLCGLKEGQSFSLKNLANKFTDCPRFCVKHICLRRSVMCEKIWLSTKMLALLRDMWGGPGTVGRGRVVSLMPRGHQLCRESDLLEGELVGRGNQHNFCNELINNREMSMPRHSFRMVQAERAQRCLPI